MQTKEQIKALKAQKAKAAAKAEAAAKESAEQRRKHDVSALWLATASAVPISYWPADSSIGSCNQAINASYTKGCLLSWGNKQEDSDISPVHHTSPTAGGGKGSGSPAKGYGRLFTAEPQWSHATSGPPCATLHRLQWCWIHRQQSGLRASQNRVSNDKSRKKCQHCPRACWPVKCFFWCVELMTFDNLLGRGCDVIKAAESFRIRLRAQT